MKQYPSIPKEINRNIFCYAFAKNDGSQIRAEWSRKNKFDKFGSRHVLLDKSNPILGRAIDLIKNKYEKDLSDIFQEERIEKATCFFEFFGPSSFAGNHVITEQQDAVLFDVDVYKEGLMVPSEFLKLFNGKVEIAPLLYSGKANSTLESSVKESKLDNMPFEGVVCKASNPKKTLQPIMFKIKSQAWLDKLKNFCGEDAELFKKLV